MHLHFTSCIKLQKPPLPRLMTREDVCFSKLHHDHKIYWTREVEHGQNETWGFGNHIGANWGFDFSLIGE